ncbi:MAG: HEPN domain-containing protein [Thermoflexales bacterium]|nr:HEPN domain-containing protein [Thermoflexales bacterium]
MRRTRAQVVLEFIREWLRKAEADLRAAEYLLALEQDDYFAVAFHAQQAAEKFLKALLVCYQIPFPKTHDIQRLLQLAATMDASVEQELSTAAFLTPFGVEFRYPGGETASREVAQRCLQEAERVRDGVLRRVRNACSGEG